MGNFFQLFAERVAGGRERDCIQTHDGTSYLYVELFEGTARYARVLVDAGILPEDRVAVCVEKTPEAIFLYLACLQIGAVYLPLNNAYRPREIAYFLENARPSALICDPAKLPEIMALELKIIFKCIWTLDAKGTGSLNDQAQKAKPLMLICRRDIEDVAALLYTSGTTGRSKGAMLTHGNLISNALTLTQIWQFTDRDILLHALPLFHVHGLFVALHCVLLSAAKMILLPKFNTPMVIHFLPQCTAFMGVPTFYSRLLNDKHFGRDVCAHMRLFISGSAPLSVEIFDRFQALTGHAILERYGMTEAGMICSNPLNGPRIAGKVGKPLPGIDIRITRDTIILPNNEVGVLEVKGPNVFKGYWEMPEKTADDMRDDGYFVTGDLACRDDNGDIAIVGRIKDMIITGGYNVYPIEIELLLGKMSAVLESAVIGVPDNDYGEAVIAFVVLKPTQQMTEDEIKQILKLQLAPYKIPKRILFVSELPRNTMGKIRKDDLRKEAIEKTL